MERIDTCSICCETYGEDLRPRVLSCGHNYCTDCLQKMIKNNSLSCPTCLKVHRVKDASEIAVNFDLEKSLAALADMKHAMSHSQQSAAKGRKMENLIAEQKSSAREQQILTENMKTELLDYDEFLSDSAKDCEESAQNLKICALKYDVLAEKMKEERKKIRTVMEEADSFNRELEGSLQSLETAVSAKSSAAGPVTKLVESVEQLDDWLDRCGQQFPDPKFASFKEANDMTTKFIADMEYLTAEGATSWGPFDSDMSIMDKVTLNFQKSFSLENIADVLRETQWQKRIASGNAITIESSKEVQRFSKLSLKEGKIYLHCLQEKPDHRISAFQLEHTQVIGCLDKEDTVVFLDIAWGGSFQGRVHIRLLSDTPLARQFRILCTGDLGPSYLNTKLFQAESFNAVSEYIRGGDYQHNDGSGGEVVIEGINLDDPVYKRQCEAGIVWAYSANVQHYGAQFVITTGSGTHFEYVRVFGKVQDGLFILREAVKRKLIANDVEIIDCGVVLKL